MKVLSRFLSGDGLSTLERSMLSRIVEIFFDAQKDFGKIRVNKRSKKNRYEVIYRDKVFKKFGNIDEAMGCKKVMQIAFGITECIRAMHYMRPIDEYNEKLGPVLWWDISVDEAPFYGTPKDNGWKEQYTHWSLFVDAEIPA